MPSRTPSGKAVNTYKRPTKKSTPKYSAPKPDVTLGGDKTPERSGHAKPKSTGGNPPTGATQRALDLGSRSPGKTGKAVQKGRKQGQRRKVQRQNRRLRREIAGLTGAAGRHRLNPDRDTMIGLGPLGHLNVEAELEGRGLISKAAKIAKRGLDAGTHIRVPGRPGTSTKTSGVPGGELTTKLAKDAVDYGSQIVPAAYGVGAGAYEAARGRPQRIKQIGHQVKEHDPIALAAQGRTKEAKQEALKHPGLTALELYGAGSVVSRGAGAGLRHAPSERLRQAGSTEGRASARVPGTKLQVKRKYSKGAGAKAIQVAADRAKTYRAKSLREKAGQTDELARRRELNRQAAAKDPTMMSNRAIARRGSEQEDLFELRRRKAIGHAAKRGREVLRPDAKVSRLKRGARKLRHPLRENPKDHRAAVALLIAQNIIKPTRKSATAYLRQLEREGVKLTDARKKAGVRFSDAKERSNLRLRDQLTAALKDEGLDFNVLHSQAREFYGEAKPRQQALVEHELLPAERERMSPQVNYAVQEMGAKWRERQQTHPFEESPRPEGDGWVEGRPGHWSRPAVLTRNGKRLTVDEIEAHMTANDVKPGAYVTQAPRQGGARNFYSSWSDPQMVGGKSRTGEAVRQGTFAVDREVGAEALAHPEGLHQATQSYGDALREVRYQEPGQRTDFDTYDQAAQFKEDHLADSPYEWDIAATRPVFGRKAQSEALLSDARDAGAGIDITDGIRQALKGEGGGRFVLVPKAWAKEVSAHKAFLGNRPFKTIRKGGRIFSGTVLTTNGFTWPIGNLGEGLLRNLVIRAGPAKLILMHRTIAELRKVDPKLADDLELQIGTGHLGSYEMANVHMAARELQSTRMDFLARQFGRLARTPGPKQMGQAWELWTRAIFGGNGWMEHQLRLAAAGRHLANEGFTPKWFRDGPKAMQRAAEQAAHGMKGTPEQVQAARFVDRAMGQYSKWSPGMRFTVGVFTPFVAWSLNAIKFLTDVLPRDHPILTGLLATSERTTEEWRRMHGLGKFVDGAAPGWLQPSVPVGDTLYPAGRYTPFGFFGDPIGTLSGNVTPQWNAIGNAAQGLDWKGDVLAGFQDRGDVTDAAKLKAMGAAFAGAMIPYFGLQQRIRDKGAGKALNPIKGYQQNPKLEHAFNRSGELAQLKKDMAKPDEDAGYATPEYARLHREWRHLQEYIFRATHGKSGRHFKTPYRPKPYAGPKPKGGGGSNPFAGSSSSGASGDNPFK